MIDTLHLYLNSYDGKIDIDQLADRMTNTVMSTNAKTGECWVNGNLSNLKISASAGYISVKGSLPNYYFGGNARIIKRSEIAEALEKMSDELSLPMIKARVNRIDVSYHWQMSKPINSYLSRLGRLSRYERVKATENTLYYYKGGKERIKTLCFYNKNKEYCEKNKELPEVYDDTNLLRYECRFNKRVNKQLGVELFAGNISDKSIYKMLVSHWKKCYDDISKNRTISKNFDNIHDVKSANKWLLGYLLSEADATTISDILSDMREQKVFSDNKYYSRLQKYLDDAKNKVVADAGKDLMRELDMCVTEVASYPR